MQHQEHAQQGVTRVHALGLVALHHKVHKGIQLDLGHAMHPSSHLHLLRAPLLYGQLQPLSRPPQYAHLHNQLLGSDPTGKTLNHEAIISCLAPQVLCHVAMQDLIPLPASPVAECFVLGQQQQARAELPFQLHGCRYQTLLLALAVATAITCKCRMGKARCADKGVFIHSLQGAPQTPAVGVGQ